MYVGEAMTSQLAAYSIFACLQVPDAENLVQLSDDSAEMKYMKEHSIRDLTASGIFGHGAQHPAHRNLGHICCVFILALKNSILSMSSSAGAHISSVIFHMMHTCDIHGKDHPHYGSMWTLVSLYMQY